MSVLNDIVTQLGEKVRKEATAMAESIGSEFATRFRLDANVVNPLIDKAALIELAVASEVKDRTAEVIDRIIRELNKINDKDAG